MSEKGIEAYSCVILGTGVKESILAGLLSSKGLKVLQMDASPAYGSSSRTLRYEEFIEEMKKKHPARHFENVLKEDGKFLYFDLTPKIFLADEGLIRIVGENSLSHCIEFSVIEAQYLIRKNEAVLIPNTKTSALKSNLFGPIQLLRLHTFMNMVRKYYEEDEREKKKALAGWKNVQEMYEYYKISASVQTVLGHGVALYTSDEYLKEPPKEFVERLTTYFRSVAKASGVFSKGNSPFLYPKYGISEISQGFARLSAVKGGTTRMSTQIKEMAREEDRYVMKIETDGVEDVVHTKFIIANDEYYASVPGSFGREIHTLRGIYVLKGGEQAKSRQGLVISGNGGPDLFVLIVGAEEEVCPAGYSIGYLTQEYAPNSEKDMGGVEDVEKELEERAAPVTAQMYLWNYSIVQSVFWVDSAVEGVPGIDPLIVPLRPMDSTVDFRTVHKEVEDVLDYVQRA